MSHESGLILFSICAIIALVVMIARFKVHPFIALTIVAVAIGFQSGMKLSLIAKTFQEGVGNTLGFLSLVVGLGLMLGKMLAESGGAQVVAQNFISMMGEKRLPWAMLMVALVIGVPVFFAVGLLLLVPVVLAIARETRTPLLKIALPALAGLSVAQGLLPPHPGPMISIEQLHANVGKTIFYGALVGLPTAIVAGPLFGIIVSRRLQVAVAHGEPPKAASGAGHSLPGFALTLLTMLLPVLLMLLATLADLLLDPDSRVREWADFFGSPVIAMLLAVIFACYSFGYARGFTGKQLLKFFEDCLAPGAGIILVVGAGGGLSKILDKGGLGAIIANGVQHASVSPLILGWLVAASIRVAVGSATVAITMASAIMAPVAATSPHLNKELLVLTMGAGSLFLSHVNDSGFWLVKESFGLTVPQTLKTWTIMETSIGLVALIVILIFAQFLPA